MEQAEADNLSIKRMIESNHPFFIGRIAGIELKVAYYVSKGEKQAYTQEVEGLENNAGIHIHDSQSMFVYTTQLVEAYTNCTVIAEWERSGQVFAYHGMGQELISERTPTIPKINALALEPYYYKDSWMTALKGKRILIVHPFVDTIKKQIEKRSVLFPGRSWFEECEIQCISPPLTLAGNHQGKDWQEHYASFLSELQKVNDFDIALVAAGGYGMLISNYIFTTTKKSVIYVGGALQLFFGIIGKRWFDNKRILSMVQEEWVRPSEKPENHIRVEKGCYW